MDPFSMISDTGWSSLNLAGSKLGGIVDAHFVVGTPTGQWLLVTESVRDCDYIAEHSSHVNTIHDMLIEGEITGPEDSCSFPEHGLYLDCGCRFSLMAW